MAAVSNTSPILNLAIIGRLSLMKEQFGQIIIPPAVISVLRLNDELPGTSEIRRGIDDKWILVQEVKDRFLVKSLQRELDDGEAEAIALSCEIRSQGLLLDEHEARSMAKSIGLKVTGILGILLRAKNEGRIPSVREEMESLRNKAGFRISETLFSDLLNKCGEKQRLL